MNSVAETQKQEFAGEAQLLEELCCRNSREVPLWGLHCSRSTSSPTLMVGGFDSASANSPARLRHPSSCRGGGMKPEATRRGSPARLPWRTWREQGKQTKNASVLEPMSHPGYNNKHSASVCECVCLHARFSAALALIPVVCVCACVRRVRFELCVRVSVTR